MTTLDQERSEIAERLSTLEQQVTELARQPPQLTAHVMMASPTAEKIALFRDLFRGREEVFPRRWENPNSGKAGYSPVCRKPILASLRVTPPGCTRQARCLACGHDTPLPVDALLGRWRGHATLDNAIGSLRCSACGARDVEHILTRVGT